MNDSLGRRFITEAYLASFAIFEGEEMTFAIILVCSIAACFILRNPIYKWPMVFYVLAVVVNLTFISGSYFDMPRDVWIMFFLLIQKCTLSLALFIVVMYIGVLGKDSRIGHWLRPIRAELSIIAWILSLGHMAVYLESYVPRVLAGGTFNTNLLVSFVVAIVLFVLLILLGVTSFNVVKKHMKTDVWMRVQKLAYPFFILTYAHLLIILLPSALRGAQAATITVAVYSVIFIAYIVLRLMRAYKDRYDEAPAEGVVSEH